jgi:hypothetical protein
LTVGVTRQSPAGKKVNAEAEDFIFRRRDLRMASEHKLRRKQLRPLLVYFFPYPSRASKQSIRPKNVACNLESFQTK